MYFGGVRGCIMPMLHWSENLNKQSGQNQIRTESASDGNFSKCHFSAPQTRSSFLDDPRTQTRIEISCRVCCPNLNVNNRSYLLEINLRILRQDFKLWWIRVSCFFLRTCQTSFAWRSQQNALAYRRRTPALYFGITLYDNGVMYLYEAWQVQKINPNSSPVGEYWAEK